MVEGRDLVDLGERELQFLRERRKMRDGELSVAVLDPVQVLDQQVAPARRIAEERPHFVERLRLGPSCPSDSDVRACALIIGPRERRHT